MYEMIRRDKNHPSIIMWNVANEPGKKIPRKFSNIRILASNLPVAYDYFSNISSYTKEIDPTHRLVTLVNDVDFTGQTCAEFFDVVCVNRYYSWYSDPGIFFSS
jgi:beta-glucuronidase